MPLYRCPKCGRIVEKPEGKYYCKVCGPSAVMVEIIRKTEVPTTHEEKLEVANEIIQILRRKGYKAKLAGSVARGTDTPYSDVDILVNAPAEKYHDLMTDKDIVKCLRKHPDVVVDFILI